MLVNNIIGHFKIKPKQQIISKTTLLQVASEQKWYW